MASRPFWHDLRDVLTRDPARIACRHRDWNGAWRNWSCAELWDGAGAFEHLHLSTDARDDGCVGWIGPNHPEILGVLAGCALMDLALVPLNHRLTVAELEALRDDCGFTWLYGEADPACVHDFARRFGQHGGDAPDPAPWPAGGSPPLILSYTSGTTGAPKGAVLTQAAVMANIAHGIALFGITPADRVLTVLPLFHMGGLAIQTLPALMAGATLILHARFEADAFFDSIRDDRPTLTLLVPAVMAALVAHPRWDAADLSCLRAVGAGSSDVPPDLIAAFHAKGVPVQQVYGMTESGPIAIAQSVAEAWAHPGSIGFPVGDCQARIGPDGEIQLRGPNLFSGYWNAPAATAAAFTADGWFRTGDAGRQDADGRFWFTDRLKHLIISGGENIAPAEVERVLLSAPGVKEAAVVGRPDSRWGEVPVAVVVPGEGFDEAAVLRHFEGRLARFKHPRAVMTADALPRTALGKVQVAALRALVGG